MHQKQSVQVVPQEVDQCGEVVEAEVYLGVHKEVEEILGIEDEGAVGEEEEEEASVLGEEVEGVILILPDLALVAEDHNLSGLALRQSAF